jgi:D,D-heptose 1,7-bisphosphate phosphatase
MHNRAVFLDRDGVINGHVYNPEFGTVDSPANPDEFVLLPDVSGAIAEFKRLGFLTIVVSNQPGVAKGRFRKELLEEITLKMLEMLGSAGASLDDIFYCLHHPNASVAEYRLDCECRKPKPGLLLQAANKWGINLVRSFMVGDGITDILAGAAVGTRTFFVSPRKCYVCDQLVKHGTRPDFFIASLAQAAEVICNLEIGDGERVQQFLPGGCFPRR